MGKEKNVSEIGSMVKEVIGITIEPEPMTSLTLPVSYVDELIAIKIIPQEPHYAVIRRLLDTSSLTKKSRIKQ